MSLQNVADKTSEVAYSIRWEVIGVNFVGCTLAKVSHRYSVPA